MVARCQELPGQELFQYVDDEGAVQDIDSADVNEYLREIAGEEFTAKDFRTWAGTMLAALALQEFETFDSQTQAKKNVVSAIERVAERLGNTPSVCRKCYVHPVILDAYLDGSMIDALQRRAKQEMEESLGDLRPEEAAVMALLQNRLAREGEARAKTGALTSVGRLRKADAALRSDGTFDRRQASVLGNPDSPPLHEPAVIFRRVDADAWLLDDADGDGITRFQHAKLFELLGGLQR